MKHMAKSNETTAGRARTRQNVDDAVAAEPIFYEDGKDWRIVDPRPHGAECIPLLAFGNFSAVRPGALLHVHPGCIEACLCLRGNVRYEADGTIYPVLPGHVFVSRPNEAHRRLDNPKGMMLYRLLFSIPKKGASILGLSAAETKCLASELEHQPCRLFHSTARLRSAFARFFAVLDAPAANRILHRIEVRNVALELLLALVDAPHAPHNAKVRPNAKVRAIAARIADDPTSDAPIASLAAEAALSSFAFTEAFKMETGLTPHAYLMDQRVRHAARDLREGRASISAAADKWRFSSPQHMATAFKRILGLTPSEVCRRA